MDRAALIPQRRRDPKRRADRATDHDPQAPPLRFRRQRERLGQPTRFVAAYFPLLRS